MCVRLLNVIKTQLLSSYVVAFVFVSGIASADSLSTRYGQATCSETIDNNTGESLEFYGEIVDNNPTIGFKYVIEFQKPLRIGKCDDLNRLTIKRMQLDLERQRLELQMLRERREAEQRETNRLDPDW